MSKTPLAEAVAFQHSHEFHAFPSDKKTAYFRNDALAYGYAWGRLDHGAPAVISLHEGQKPSTSSTAWAFGALYAQMLMELNDSGHPRTVGLSVQSAWDIFAATGCPDGALPQRQS